MSSGGSDRYRWDGEDGPAPSRTRKKPKSACRRSRRFIASPPSCRSRYWS